MMQFTAPPQLTLHYKIVTPMFLGGENHKVDDTQMRNASLKGALRFWWRALNWGRMLQAANQSESDGLKKLHAEEGRLFGKASDGKDSQQSQVRLSSTLTNAKLERPGSDLASASLGYLLGQGLYHFRDKVLREHLSDGQLELTLSFKPGIDPQGLASVRQAAIALGIFGGLGSRARKGLGSLSIQSIAESGQTPQTFTTLSAIKQFIATLDFSAPENAPLSALSVASRIDLSATGTSAVKVLGDVGREMQLYRSFGQNGKVNGQPARRNFVADHDNVLESIQGKSLSKLPERAVFGLPHNYFFSSTKTGVNINPPNPVDPTKEGRRASPLFIHIHALEDNTFVAIQTLLPTRFLPQGMAIDVKPQRGRTHSLHDNRVDYTVIKKYLDGFEKLNKGHEVLRRG